jgi:hygromycin-B 7''-O-kinase
MDLTLWEPYVRQVCAQNGFGCSHINPGVPGSFPTFIVEINDGQGAHPGRAIVVKFFGPLLNGADAFRIERDLGEWLEQHTLSIPSPRILVEGQLDPEWKYLIFEYVPGVSIGQVRDQLSRDDWTSIAHQMGEYMHCLHSLSIELAHQPPWLIQPSSDRYINFLEQQQLNCPFNHQSWKDLPDHLLGQIEGFILPLNALIDYAEPAYLIHADLTADHLLGRMVNNHWHTLAIIDWGDAMLGNILYELVAVHLDIFQSDKDLLRICLDAYDLPEFYRQDFPRKALSMVLLHQFPMPPRVYAPFLDLCSLDELAECLFGG